MQEPAQIPSENRSALIFVLLPKGIIDAAKINMMFKNFGISVKAGITPAGLPTFQWF
jgi:hypothetical protein